MITHLKDNILYFKFPGLAEFPGLAHGVFTRHGGHSPAPFNSMNVSCNGGDDADTVESNRSLIADCLGAGRPITFSDQIHGPDVVSLKQADTSKIPAKITGDAMITDIPGMPLGIQLADCQAILLYDPVKSVVANVHSGWRGSIQNIAGKTIGRMQSDFSCRPENVRAAVSPSLGPCCSEFINYQTEIPEKFWSYGNSRNYFNFWVITRDQLTAAGVLAEHIEFSNTCTKCNEHLFYSFRKSPKTGRFAAVIELFDH